MKKSGGVLRPRVVRDLILAPGVAFFFSAQVGGLTNYVIRHISKYGKYDIITEQPFRTTFANSFSGDLLQLKTCQIVLQ